MACEEAKEKSTGQVLEDLFCHVKKVGLPEDFGKQLKESQLGSDPSG